MRAKSAEPEQHQLTPSAPWYARRYVAMARAVVGWLAVGLGAVSILVVSFVEPALWLLIVTATSAATSYGALAAFVRSQSYPSWITALVVISGATFSLSTLLLIGRLFG